MSPAADLVQIEPGVAYIPGNPNCGVISAGSSAILVDAGIDKDRARALIKALDRSGMELAAVMLTHSHADHMGGCAYLASRTGARIYASAFEAAFVENPILEPAMLLSGAVPWHDMRGKFVLAQPAPVAGLLLEGLCSVCGVEIEVIPLPGHSLGSLGFRIGDVLFAGDAVFSREVLRRFAVPYNTDVGCLLGSHSRIAGMPCKVVIPGHGDPSDTGIAEENTEVMRETLTRVRLAVEQGPSTGEEITARVCLMYGAPPAAPALYYLAHAGIMACLSYMTQQGLVIGEIVEGEGRMVWRLPD